LTIAMRRKPCRATDRATPPSTPMNTSRSSVTVPPKGMWCSASPAQSTGSTSARVPPAESRRARPLRHLPGQPHVDAGRQVRPVLLDRGDGDQHHRRAAGAGLISAAVSRAQATSSVITASRIPAGRLPAEVAPAKPRLPAGRASAHCAHAPADPPRLLLLATPSSAQEAVHGGPVRALAAAPDGGLASAGFDQSVIFWDPAAAGRAPWCAGMPAR
jgi:hypothetical protein